jgi:sugar lactone lactonase YvrE
LILFFILILILYLWLAPSLIEAQAWNPDPIPTLEGQYARNERLKQLQLIHQGQCYRCEDIAIDTLGALYGGEENGNIFKFYGGERILLANTEGRPLGLDFDLAGNLIIADAIQGLLRMNHDGNIDILSNQFEGTPFGFTDDVEVGSDGKYYFTDASVKYGYGDEVLDLMEHGGHGALYVYDPITEETSQLLDGLQFANGVAVSSDASYVLYNETGNMSVSKYWLAGSKKGQSEPLITNLPGYPDGISRGSDNVYWLTLVAPRNPQVEKLMPHPKVLNTVMKLPRFIVEPEPKPYGFILGIDGDGNILYNLQDEDPALFMITSVQESEDALYFGTLHDDAIGKMSIEQIK